MLVLSEGAPFKGDQLICVSLALKVQGPMKHLGPRQSVWLVTLALVSGRLGAGALLPRTESLSCFQLSPKSLNQLLPCVYGKQSLLHQPRGLPGVPVTTSQALSGSRLCQRNEVREAGLLARPLITLALLGHGLEEAAEAGSSERPFFHAGCRTLL